MRALTALIDWLTRDVSPWGGLASPALCWIGAGALIAFFAYQTARLLIGVARARDPFDRVAPRLRAFAEEVEAIDLDRAYDRAFADRRPTVPPGPETADVDRLRELDQAMRAIDALRRPWIRFRKTLLIEHVRWFKEPRVFSTRGAEEFFAADTVIGTHIDLAFYAQVPAVITGVGLLLTFVAICVGLSRLHADGQSIAGIAGLINGLSGKFLTSIVGLICANVFVLVERPAVRRLLDRHAELVALLDESFPRRTAEDLLDELRRIESQGRDVRDGLSALAGAIKSLETDKSRAQAQIASLVDQLGAAVTAIGGDGPAAGKRRDDPAQASDRTARARQGVNADVLAARSSEPFETAEPPAVRVARSRADRRAMVAADDARG